MTEHLKITLCDVLLVNACLPAPTTSAQSRCGLTTHDSVCDHYSTAEFQPDFLGPFDALSSRPSSCGLIPNGEHLAAIGNYPTSKLTAKPRG